MTDAQLLEAFRREGPTPAAWEGLLRFASERGFRQQYAYQSALANAQPFTLGALFGNATRPCPVTEVIWP